LGGKIRRRIKKSARRPKKILKRKKMVKKHREVVKKPARHRKRSVAGRHKKVVKKARPKKKKIVRKIKRHKRVKRIKRTKKTRKTRKIKKIRKVGKGRRIRKHKKIRKIRRVRKSRKAKISKPKTFIGKGILEQLFESQAKVKLMKLFFRNLDETFPIRDILKMLRVNPSSVRREMKKLEKIGIIRKIKKQGRIVYQLDEGFDFIKELKDLILKSTISSKEELIRDVKKLGNIKLLVLSGIFRGNEGTEADMLIVGDKINQRKFSTFLKDLESEAGKELNCALMSSKEFNYRYDMYDRFIRDLLKDNGEILFNKLNLW